MSILSAVAFELAPAAIFGAAVLVSTATWLSLPSFNLGPAAAGSAAFGGVWLALHRFGSPKASFPLPAFDRPEMETAELSAVGELLEEAAVVGIVEQLGAQQAPEPPEELILDNVVEAIGPQSRVVQLFKPNETAGELQERIDQHLLSGPRPVPDATQELHDALAALRRSLR